jgi:small subunit ribosomal protein S15
MSALAILEICANMYGMLTKRKKENAIKEVKLHDTDTGSAEAQVAIISKRIEELSSHLKKNTKDNHSRKGLLGMVADRKTHLKYLEKKNPKRYTALIKKLGLKK